MARNSLSYEARIVSIDKKSREPVALDFTRSANGTAILKLVLVEQHSDKKGRVLKSPTLKHYAEDERNASKGADDYVNTTSTWHRLTVMGEKAEQYAQDADFNHGALIVIKEASYTEEEPWEIKGATGVSLRAGRPESIGDYQGELEIKFAPREDVFGPTWDGVSEVKKAGGSGGGGAASMPSVDEGF